MWNRIRNLFKFTKDIEQKPTPPNVTAIIVFTPEEAEKLAGRIPDSIIVNKVRNHVKKTGTSGLAGDIIKTF